MDARECSLNGGSLPWLGADVATHDEGSGGRARHPEETLSLLLPRLAEVGVTRVAVATGLDSLKVPVAMATRPLSFSLSVTQGKGLSVAAAKVSAVMEAVEHYHAETIQGVFCWSSEAELKRAVPTATLAGRLTGFEQSERLQWIQGHSLLGSLPTWVPFDLVHLDLRVDGPAHNIRFVPSSNGLASGNSLGEAACHGVCEVTERHLLAEFMDLSAAEQETRRLDLATVHDPVCIELLRRLAAVGLTVTVWDLSSQLGLAAFLSEIQDAKPDELRLVPLARGAAAHPSRQVAFTKAILEAVQSRLTLISGARDDIQAVTLAQRRRAVAEAHQRQLAREASLPARSYLASPDVSFSRFSSQLSWLGERLVASGFGEPVVVDLSKPRFPVQVVRVVVPGMRFGKTEVSSKHTWGAA
jgi:YcaO-like protein with predicted kinase domain